MPDFNANADVYVVVMKPTQDYRFLSPPRPIHSGTIAESIAWTLANHDGYPESYSMKVPLEAGFGTTTLHYLDMHAIVKRADFPKG
jgi:hypothetical protein